MALSWETFYSAHLGLRGSGANREAKCPFHEDSHASLSVNIDTGSWKCHAGCGGGGPRQFAEKMGTDFDPMPDSTETCYDYRDEKGTVLYQVVRTADKRFHQKRLRNGVWEKSLGDVRRLLYRLPELLASTGPVYIVEGEKDVETLTRAGFTATCNSGGSSAKWPADHSRQLRNRIVNIIPDNDQPGLDHGHKILDALRGIAAEIRVVNLPNLPLHGDVSDWLTHGRTAAQLHAVTLDTTPAYIKPPPPPKKTTLEDLFLTALPEYCYSGLPGDYVRVMGPTTEAPDTFHLASFLNVMGNLLGRSVWAWYSKRCYPNLYTCLVGETGAKRKSTAAGGALGLHKELDANVKQYHSFGSAEVLTSLVDKSDPQSRPDLHRRALLYLDELATLLIKMRRPGTENMAPAMVSMWDGHPLEDNSKGGGQLSVQYPAVSLLGCSQPDSLRRHLLEIDVLSGFANRFMLFDGVAKDPIDMPPQVNAEWAALVRGLRGYIEMYARNPREITLAADARKLWAETYRTWGRTPPSRTVVADLFQRAPENAIKVALVYACLQGSYEISVENLQCGIAIALYSARVMIDVMGDVTSSERTRIEHNTITAIKRSGEKGISVNELAYVVRGATRDDLRRICNGLVADGNAIGVQTARTARFVWSTESEELTDDVMTNRVIS